MSYGNLKSDSKSKYLRVKEGKDVDINILTSSENVIHQFVHISDKKERSICVKGQCALCQDGDQPKERWNIVVYNWTDGCPQLFEFGFSIFNQIRNIASLLEESGMTIHDTNLRIKATGSGFNTKYQIMQLPKREPVPEGLVLPKLQKDIEVPF